jgi:hypothetical protein
MLAFMDVEGHSGKVRKSNFILNATIWVLLVCFSGYLLMDWNYRSKKENNSSNIIRSHTVATALETAVTNFFTEYGKSPTADSKTTTNSPEGIRLLQILLGSEPAGDNLQNPRYIKYLSVKEGKKKRGGLIYSENGKSVEGLFDPWGNPYTLEIDTDYDEILEFNLGGRSIKLEGSHVAVHSPGKDGKHATGDDVATW